MTFNLLSSAWFFLRIIPLIAFYFLKLRRQRVEIPSLVLWQQVLQDSRVNSPFQKFKRNLLLLLQLLLLCLLVLAAMDPIVSGNSSDQKMPIIVDCSASMGASDDKQTRLEEAKEKIREIINNKKSSQEIAIISFAKTAKKVCSFTTNSQVLLKTIDDLQVTDLESNLESALKVTQAMTKSGKFGEVLLFSDGNFEDVPTFDLSYKLNFQLVGKTQAPNIGISQLSARRAGPTSWMVFIQLQASNSYVQSSTVEIYQNDQKIAEDTLSSDSQKEQRISFRVDGTENSTIKVLLKPAGKDLLDADNTAWMTLGNARPLKVFIAPSLGSISTVVRNIPGLSLTTNPADSVDLSISDDQNDEATNSLIHMSVGYVPDSIANFIATKSDQSTIIDWNRSAQLLQHVTLDDTLLMQTYEMKDGSSPTDIEKKSFEVLITGEKAPLLIRKKIGLQSYYHFLFHPDQSTLPYKVAFPIMLTNLINEGLQVAGLAETEAKRTGFLPKIKSTPNTEVSVTLPNRSKIKTLSDANGTLNGIAAEKAGSYTVSQSDKDDQVFHASLLSSLESEMSTKNSVMFNETSVSASNEEAITDKPLWSKLAFIAFILLVLEWWFYQKRPGKILPQA